MLNPRITSVVPKVLVAIKARPLYTPDFSQENALYREFGNNSEIDIMRSHPEYQQMINSKLQKIQDVGLDTSEFTDEQLSSGVIGRQFDENEVTEFLSKDKETRLSELNSK